MMAKEVLLAAFVGLSSCHLIPGTAEAAFHEFQTNQHKESFIVGPLCAAGETVVPLVVEKVKDRNLKRRVYAVGFLGSTQSQLAADSMEALVGDESESEAMRRAALQSLFMIDRERGRRVAQEFTDRQGYLGEIAREVLRIEDHGVYKKSNSACNITD